MLPRFSRPAALRLPAIVLACLICVPALAQEAGLTVAPDGAKQHADLVTGRWIDLVATIDPGAAGVALEGLKVTVTVTGEAQVGEAILPPGHEDGVYRSPFTVRVPVRPMEEGKLEATVTAEGRKADGSAFRASGGTALRAWGTDPSKADEASRIRVEARVKHVPARVGEPNAVVVGIDVAQGWHIYGAQVDIGVPATVALLPAGPRRLWDGGGTVTPPGDHLEGSVTVEIPFTPLVAGRVDTRVSVLHMACTEEMCDPVALVYAPVSYEAVDTGTASNPAPGPSPAPAAAEPFADLAIGFDGQSKGLSLLRGEPLDLLVEVTPRTPLPATPLSLTVTHDGEATEGGFPVLPPPDDKGRYTKPFTIRVPFMPAKTGKLEIEATLVAGDGAKVSVKRRLEAYKPIGSLPGLGTGDLPGGARMVTTAHVRDVPVVAGEPNAVVLRVKVADGWHVYGTDEQDGLKTVVELLPAGQERLWSGGGPVTPPGRHLAGEFDIAVPFTALRAGPVVTRARILWMACTEETCDPPAITYVPVAFDAREGDAEAVARARDSAAAAGAASAGDGTGEDGNDIARMALGTLILVSIGAGLFALAMPCTYPMIPITISFFTKQAEAREGRVVGLALMYGLGIVLIFTAIGAIVGLTTIQGSAIIDFANNAIVNAVLALLFLAFGLSLLGLFELRLPTWFDNFAMKASAGGGTLGVFAMGATLVITSFTCTAPLVGALLVAASAGGSLGRVMLGMGVFGTTMAVPFVILSMSPTAIQKLPRSGEWMKHLKVTLGIVELGLVLKFMSNIDLQMGTYLIGRELFLVLWLSSFAIAGLYLLGVFDLFRAGTHWSLTRGRGVAAVLLLAVAGFLALGVGGKRLPIKQVEAFLPSFEHEYGNAFEAVVLDDYDAGVRKAEQLHAPVFLHFTGFQ